MSENPDDILFEVPVPPGPVPPPFPPLPPHAPTMVYVSREVGEGTRDHEDLMLRKVPRETAMRFRAAAGGRGLTYAQYLAALVELHETARRVAESGNEAVAAELERLGLQTVTV